MSTPDRSALAEPTDVQVRLMRSLTSEEAALATVLLAEASAQLRLKVASVDDRIGDRSLDPAIVKGVIARAVLRVLRNPEGVKQLQKSTGPYAETRTADSAVSSGLLSFSAEDLALVEALPSGSGIPGAGTVRLGPPPYLRDGCA